MVFRTQVILNENRITRFHSFFYPICQTMDGLDVHEWCESFNSNFCTMYLLLISINFCLLKTYSRNCVPSFQQYAAFFIEYIGLIHKLRIDSVRNTTSQLFAFLYPHIHWYVFLCIIPNFQTCQTVTRTFFFAFAKDCCITRSTPVLADTAFEPVTA